MPDPIGRFLIASIFFLAFSENVALVTVRGYSFSLPALLYFVLSGWCLFACMDGRLSLSRFKFLAAYLFLLWSAATLAIHFELSSFLSLGVLAAFVLPVVMNIDDSDWADSAMRWFVRGALCSVVFALLDVGFSFGLVPPTSSWMPGYGASSTYEVHGVLRVKGLFFEPSHYAFYLVFAIACADYLRLRSAGDVWRYVVEALLIAALLLTFSVSGYVLCVGYFGLTYAFRVVKLLRSKSLEIDLRALLGRSALALMLVLSFLVVDSKIGVSEYLERRFERAAQYAGSGDLAGSEGSRINILPAAVDLLIRDDDSSLLLTGNGFNAYEKYLRTIYGNAEIHAATGSVHNVYAVLILGVGVVGLLLYFVLSLSLAPKSIVSWSGAVFCVWLVAHFATGRQLGYMFWLPVLLVTWTGIKEDSEHAA